MSESAKAVVAGVAFGLVFLPVQISTVCNGDVTRRVRHGSARAAGTVGRGNPARRGDTRRAGDVLDRA